MLYRARIDAGLSVEDVSNTTRVRASLVYSIEQDDFSRCGGDVYARGHIRNLARAVGIDPEPLVEQYVAEHDGGPAQTSVAPLYQTERIRAEPRRANWAGAMIAAIVVVIIFVGFTLFSGSDSGSTQTVAGNPSAGVSSAAPTHPKTTAPAPAESNSAIAAAPADKVTVKLTADGGNSWVQAQDSNGRYVYQGLIAEGDSKSFTDQRRMRFVVGNAGAVRLFVNGKDLGAAGDAGKVVRLEFTPGDPQAG
jgi:cytoskeletal protein RodZ